MPTQQTIEHVYLDYFLFLYVLSIQFLIRISMLCADRLMKRVGIRDGARVIDLSSQTGTAASLLETRIMCAVEEKVSIVNI